MTALESSVPCWKEVQRHAGRYQQQRSPYAEGNDCPLSLNAVGHVEILRSLLSHSTTTKGSNQLEQVQQKAVEMVSLEHLPCEDSLGDGVLFGLERRQLQGHLTTDSQYLWGRH